MHSTTRPHGYALPLVLLVLVLLGVAFAGLIDTVRASTVSTHDALKGRAQDYHCEGLKRLAGGVTAQAFYDDPATTGEALAAKLAPVVAEANTAGISVTNDAVTAAEDDQSTALPASSPLAGLKVAQSTVRVNGSGNTTSGSCAFNFVQITSGFYATQLALFSTSGADLTDVDATLEVPAFAWMRDAFVADGNTITAVDDSAIALTLPPPPANDPTAAVATDARDLSGYIKQPDLTAPGEARDSRLAYRAGLLIVDGTWYKRSPASVMASWPPPDTDALYSDHPCATLSGVRTNGPACAGAGTAIDYATLLGTATHHRMYSLYERKQHGLYNTDNGVVSYGALPADNNGSPTSLSPPQRISYAMTPFNDRGVDVHAININMAMLANALATTGAAADEAGHLALPSRTPRAFIVYITSIQGAAPAGGAALPYALCGETPGETSIEHGVAGGPTAQETCSSASLVRYNAVRLWNAWSAQELGDNEITIATDLPLYIQGDYDPAHMNFIAARRITVLPRDFNEGTGQSNGGSPVSVRVRASVLTGWAPGTDRFVRELVRPGAPGMDLTLDGSILGGFEASHPSYMALGWNSFTWTWDDALNDPFVAAVGTPRLALPSTATLPAGVGCGGG